MELLIRLNNVINITTYFNIIMFKQMKLIMKKKFETPKKIAKPATLFSAPIKKEKVEDVDMPDTQEEDFIPPNMSQDGCFDCQECGYGLCEKCDEAISRKHGLKTMKEITDDFKNSCLKEKKLNEKHTADIHEAIKRFSLLLNVLKNNRLYKLIKPEEMENIYEKIEEYMEWENGSQPFKKSKFIKDEAESDSESEDL